MGVPNWRILSRSFACGVVAALALVACSDDGGHDAGPFPDANDLLDAGSDADAGELPPLPPHCTVAADDGDLANNTPDWTECDPEQVCVVADLDGVDHDGAPLFTCLTPVPAPTVDPGLHIADGWAAFETPTARCNNGDKVRFYFRPARDDQGEPIDSDDWLVFLKGGGGCSSAPSCAVRWVTDAYFVAPPMPRRWVPGNQGIFRTADNAFTRANQVYVHYCTSDDFRGTGTRSVHTGLHHDGHLAVQEVLDALTAGLSVRMAEGGPSRTFTLSSASRLLLVGGSAGSVGAAQNLDWVAERLEGPVVGLLDSVWVQRVLPMHHRVTEADYEMFRDASCVAAHPGEPDACDWLFDAAPYIDTPFMAYQAARDGLAYPYGGLCVAGVDAADCQAPRVLVEGLCFEPTQSEPPIEPCDLGEALDAVDPHGLSCWDDAGAGAPGYIASEAARHLNRCASTLSADGTIRDTNGDCGAGFTCWSGLCVREDFTYACHSRADCPRPEDVCLGSLCIHTADASGPTPQCLDDAYTFDEDTQKCRLSLGCASADDCEAGEVCLDPWHTPAAASIRLGVRQGFAASSVQAWFVTDGRRKHTIVNTDDDAFFQSFPQMRDGAGGVAPASLYQTLLRWIADGPSDATRLMQDPQ